MCLWQKNFSENFYIALAVMCETNKQTENNSQARCITSSNIVACFIDWHTKRNERREANKKLSGKEIFVVKKSHTARGKTLIVKTVLFDRNFTREEKFIECSLYWNN